MAGTRRRPGSLGPTDRALLAALTDPYPGPGAPAITIEFLERFGGFSSSSYRAELRAVADRLIRANKKAGREAGALCYFKLVAIDTLGDGCLVGAYEPTGLLSITFHSLRETTDDPAATGTAAALASARALTALAAMPPWKRDGC